MVDSVLSRQRLLDELNRNRAPICVICAPSGFGKTTLLRTWVAALEPVSHTVVWVALAGEVGSVSAFWAEIVAAAERLGLVADPGAAPGAVAAGSADPVALLRPLLHATRGTIVLAIDGYEWVRPVVERVDASLLHVATVVPRLRIVVTTRGGTGLVDRTVRLRADVTVIDEDHLRFTRCEVDQLLFQRGHRRGDLATSLHTATRGYPLALRAALLDPSWTDDIVTDVDAARSEFRPGWRDLMVEVLTTTLSGADQQFVIDTCAPPYLDDRLAGALSGRDDADRVLQALVWDGLGRWIPFTAERQVFQYVDAVRETLVARAKQDPDRYRQHCAQAAHWLVEHHELLKALTMAVEARALGLADALCRRILAVHPEPLPTRRMDRVLAPIPLAELRHHPVLALIRAASSASNVATRAATPRYALMAAGAAAEALHRLPAGERMLQHGVRTMALRLAHRFDASVGSAREAFREIIGGTGPGRGADPGVRPRGESRALPARLTTDWDDGLAPVVMREVAYSLFLGAEVDDAGALLATALTLPQQPGSRWLTIEHAMAVHAFAGQMAHYRETLRLREEASQTRGATAPANPLGRVGRAIAALDALDHAAALSQHQSQAAHVDTSEAWPMLTWASMSAQLGLGCAESEAHRVEAALAMSPPGVGRNLPSDALRAILAVCWVAAGRLGKAAAALQTAGPYRGQTSPASALTALARGQHDRVLANLPRYERMAGHTVRSRVALRTVAAVAARRAGNVRLTLDLLGRAVALAGDGGPRAHLVWLPAEDIAALRALAHDNGLSAVWAHLDGAVPPSRPTGARAPLDLTSRELVVLRAAFAHPSRARIAEELHVSMNTVKSQLRSIYRKLGVADRAAMIQRAIELGLVTD